MTTRVLLLQVGAALFSLLGWVVLLREGLFGSGRQVTLFESIALVSIAMLYAWWLSPIAATAQGVKGAVLALVVIDVVWVLFAAGLASFVLCSIPFCPVAAPLSDLSRYGSVVFGASAAWTAWRAYRAMPGRTEREPAMMAAVLILFSFAFQGIAQRSQF